MLKELTGFNMEKALTKRDFKLIITFVLKKLVIKVLWVFKYNACTQAAIRFVFFIAKCEILQLYRNGHSFFFYSEI